MGISDQHNEKIIIGQVAGGDEAAFNLLFARYRERLFAYLYKVTKSKETAEEVVLDVFLKIWKGRALLSEVNHFEAFLITIARNKAIDFLRRAQKDSALQQRVWTEMLESTTAQADAAIISEDTRMAIAQAVASLSPQRRMVFLLSREQGLSYEDIALKMGISSKTVGNHLSAALQQIRSRLQSEPGAAGLLLLFYYR